MLDWILFALVLGLFVFTLFTLADDIDFERNYDDNKYNEVWLKFGCLGALTVVLVIVLVGVLWTR